MYVVCAINWVLSSPAFKEEVMMRPFFLLQAFPRFYYVSDDTLLTILSNSTAVQPHLRSLFSAMGAIITTAPEEEGDAPVICAVESSEGEKLQLANPVCKTNPTPTMSTPKMSMLVCESYRVLIGTPRLEC